MNKILKKEIYNKIGDLFKEYYPSDEYNFNKPILSFNNSKRKITISKTNEYQNDMHFQIKLFPLNFEISKVKEIIFQYPIVFFKLQENVDNINDFGYQQAVSGWTICGVEDCQKMFDDHIDFMGKVGNEFFNRYSSLEGIHNYINIKFLNEFDLNGDYDHYNKIKAFFGFDKVMLAGLIAAYLVGYNEIDNLIYRYKKLHTHVNTHKLIDRISDYFEKDIVMTIEEIHAERDAKHKALIEKAKQNKEIIQNQVEVNKNIEEAEGKEIKEIESTSDAVSLYLKGGNEEKVKEWIRRDKGEIIEFCLLLEETYREDGIELDSNESEIMFKKIYNLVNNIND